MIVFLLFGEMMNLYKNTLIAVFLYLFSAFNFYPAYSQDSIEWYINDELIASENNNDTLVSDIKTEIIKNDTIDESITELKDTIASKLSKTKDKKQVECLARNIYFESRGQPHLGKLAVANVTLNRSRDTGLSVCSTVYQRTATVCQFSWVCELQESQTKQKIKINNTYWYESLIIAYLAYNNMVPDITNNAKYFYNPKIASPKWAKIKVAVNNEYFKNGVLGDHRFMKDQN